MIQFVAVVIVLAFSACTCWTIAKAFDGDSLLNPWSFLSFLLVSIAGTVLLLAAQEEEQKGPCLHYETQMYWNAGVKAMMPARVCTQRAEWIKE